VAFHRDFAWRLRWRRKNGNL